MQAKQAYELFSVQKEAFLEEKSRWEQEGRLNSRISIDDYS